MTSIVENIFQSTIREVEKVGKILEKKYNMEEGEVAKLFLALQNTPLCTILNGVALPKGTYKKFEVETEEKVDDSQAEEKVEEEDEDMVIEATFEGPTLFFKLPKELRRGWNTIEKTHKLVDEWYTKWGTLYIKYKDGRELEIHDFEESDPDVKYSTSENVLPVSDYFSVNLYKEEDEDEKKEDKEEDEDEDEKEEVEDEDEDEKEEVESEQEIEESEDEEEEIPKGSFFVSRNIDLSVEEFNEHLKYDAPVELKKYIKKEYGSEDDYIGNCIRFRVFHNDYTYHTIWLIQGKEHMVYIPVIQSYINSSSPLALFDCIIDERVEHYEESDMEPEDKSKVMTEEEIFNFVDESYRTSLKNFLHGEDCDRK